MAAMAPAVARAAQAAHRGVRGVVDRLPVDVDHSGPQAGRYGQPARKVTGVHGGRQPVVGGVGQRDGVVVVGEPGDRDDRAEDLLGKGGGFARHIVQDGGLDECPAAGPAVHQPGAIGDGLGHDLLHPGGLVLGDQRPDPGRRIRRVADPQVRDSDGHLLDIGLGQALMHQVATGGHADLALMGERALHRAGDGGVEVGVVQDGDRVVPAQLEDDPLEQAPGRRADLAAGRRRSRERDDRHAGSVTSTAPVSGPPAMTCSRPPGSPAASKMRAMTTPPARADFGSGLMTTALPSASAGAADRRASCSGAFHGAITPTTPTGMRRAWLSVPAVSCGSSSPLGGVGQGGRGLEFVDGLGELPLGLGPDAAGLADEQPYHLGAPGRSAPAASSSTFLRVPGPAAAQPGCARTALAHARLMSDGAPMPTRPTIDPSAGRWRRPRPRPLSASRRRRSGPAPRTEPRRSSRPPVVVHLKSRPA